MLDAAAWMQANLINVHVPKGKPRMTVEKLRPKKNRSGARDRDEAAAIDAVDDSDLPDLAGGRDSTPVDPKEQARQALRRAAARREAKEHAEEAERFWEGPEGRRMKELWGEE